MPTIAENKAIIERISEAVHKAWMAERARQGFHAPSECHQETGWASGLCPKCHPDMIPYADLPEHTKEYDRITAQAVLDEVKLIIEERIHETTNC